MKLSNKKKSYFRSPFGCPGMMFIPLIVMGGQLVVRVILNLWNMIEPH